MLGGERLHEQDGRADVLVQERVELGGARLGEAAVAAARVVGDQDVDVAEPLPGRGHHPRRCLGLGEVGLQMLHRAAASKRRR